MRPNPQETLELVTSAEEILNGKLKALYSIAHFTVKKTLPFFKRVVSFYRAD